MEQTDNVLKHNVREAMCPRCISSGVRARYNKTGIGSTSVQASMYFGQFVKVNKIPTGENTCPGCENGNGLVPFISSPSLYDVYGQLYLTS